MDLSPARAESQDGVEGHHIDLGPEGPTASTRGLPFQVFLAGQSVLVVEHHLVPDLPHLVLGAREGGDMDGQHIHRGASRAGGDSRCTGQGPVHLGNAEAGLGQAEGSGEVRTDGGHDARRPLCPLTAGDLDDRLLETHVDRQGKPVRRGRGRGLALREGVIRRCVLLIEPFRPGLEIGGSALGVRGVLGPQLREPWPVSRLVGLALENPPVDLSHPAQGVECGESVGDQVVETVVEPLAAAAFDDRGIHGAPPFDVEGRAHRFRAPIEHRPSRLGGRGLEPDAAPDGDATEEFVDVERAPAELAAALVQFDPESLILRVHGSERGS